MAICKCENNLVGRGSRAKLNLVSGSNMERNNLIADAGITKLNLETKGLS